MADRITTCTKLPRGYSLTAQIEIENRSVTARLLKGIQLVAAVLMFGVGCVIFPITGLTEMPDTFTRLCILMVGLMSYSVVHELIRSGLMYLFSKVKAVIHFRGAFAYTGCPAYFSKRDEIAVMLAPFLFITGLLLIAIQFAADSSWAWICYLILIVSTAVSIPDIYIILRIIGMKDPLTQNYGPAYGIFTATTDK